MNPDGLSYLDIASAAASAGPAKLVNGYWSPGYPALLSLAISLVHPSPGQEFPLVHFVNFLILIATLWSFSFFLSQWFKCMSKERTEPDNWKACITAFAFCSFLWFVLRYIGTTQVSPDLAVVAIIMLAAGLSCRFSLPGAGWRHAMALGLILGAGYYIKAVLFPLALVLLVLLLFLLPLTGGVTRRRSLLLVTSSGLVFLLVAAPLVAIMTKHVGHLSIGETGRLNYAWYANGLRWADDTEHPTAIQTPWHPAPKLTSTTLAFASPIGGTYPLWYEPSYWYSGLKVRLDLRGQIAAIKGTIFAYKDMVFDTMPFIVGAIVLFGYALAARSSLAEFRKVLWQLAWPVATFAIYGLVYVEPRYVSAFFILFWLAVYGVLLLKVDSRVGVAICATVLCSVMLTFMAHVAKESARLVRDAVRPTAPDYQVAGLGLRELGLQKGDRLAIVGFAYDCYYAHYDGLRVIAQIPNVGEFRRSGESQLASLEERLSSYGVSAVVSPARPDADVSGTSWRSIKISDADRLYVLLLPRKVASNR